MPAPSALAVFAVPALTLAVIPGPAVLYIVAKSLHQGRGAGLVSAFGVAAGGTVHVAAAAIGLSSLLVSSATAFTVVRYAGAAYLVYLGIRTLLRREALDRGVPRPPRSRQQLLRQGVVVNVLNPKTALFFFAFLPQFVDVDAGSPTLQMAFLGGLFVVIALASDSAWALVSGTAADRLAASRRLASVRRRASGTVLVGLGVAAGATEPGRA